MSFMNKCQPCDGSGYYGLDTRDTCVICRGFGVLTFEGKLEDYRECSPCGGSGYYGLLQKDTCKVCHGLGSVSLKDTPVVVLSPADEVDALWDLIHPIVTKVARGRFDANHFADAIEAVLKEINSIIKTKVKALTGSEFDGAELMYRAFSPKNPLIKLDDLSTVSGTNIQQGYMQLFAGSMIGIRNPKAHENVVIDKNRAIHFLFLASLLMYKIDESK